MAKKQLHLNHKMKRAGIRLGIYFAILTIASVVTYRYANPPPPNHIVLSTGYKEGNYELYGREYKDIIEKSGVEVRLRPSSGARENLNRLKDPRSDTDVAFVQDGLDDTEEDDGLVSLGSLYYEPLWVFYRSRTEIKRFSQLKGKRLAIGEKGAGTATLSWRLLKASGVDMTNTRYLRLGYEDAANALRKGEADAAFFLATPDDALVKSLVADKSVRLMSVDQAEAITRHMPYLHHLTLPHGGFDLKDNLPDQDMHLIATTATLVAHRRLNPFLIDLLLKAAKEVHSASDLFEKKGEFPVDKDYDFPLADEARRFYKSGAPLWQRYLPFWLATLIDRFILVVLPLLALVLPLVRSVPKVLDWRVRSRIYKRYGELKYLETQMRREGSQDKYLQHLQELDRIEERVNHMKIPLEFSEHTYVLREHIDFVRGRLRRGLQPDKLSQLS